MKKIIFIPLQLIVFQSDAMNSDRETPSLKRSSSGYILSTQDGSFSVTKHKHCNFNNKLLARYINSRGIIAQLDPKRSAAQEKRRQTDLFIEEHILQKSHF